MDLIDNVCGILTVRQGRWRDPVAAPPVRRAHLPSGAVPIARAAQAAIRRLATSIANQADRIMTIFLTLPTGPVSSKSASVIEGVIMGMGAVAGGTPPPS